MFLTHCNISSKVYYKQYYNINGSLSGEKKDIFKHKGIRSIKNLTTQLYNEILTTNKPHRVVEKQFRGERFRIYAAEIRKKLSSSFCGKRYYYNPWFSQPFSHPDIDVYLEKVAQNEPVSEFIDSSPPTFIPPYFWDKMVKNVQEKKYFRREGDLFCDFNKYSIYVLHEIIAVY